MEIINLEVKMRNWRDKEIVKLFNCVEETKENGRPIKNAFESHARDFGRKANSVRNFYYHEIDNLSQDVAKAKKMGIRLEKHKKTHFVGFSEDEEEKLIEEIDKLKLSGCSTRMACKTLSNGDLALMTRMQNKYQNIKKTELRKNNIIKFRNVKQELSEKDINSLFFGLVQLIKKTAVEDVENKMKIEKHSSEALLQKAFCDLNKKESEIFELQEEIKQLKNENQKLQKRLENEQKTQNFKKMLKHSKQQEILEV